RRDGSTLSAAPPTSNVRREIASLPFPRGILELRKFFRPYCRAQAQWDDETFPAPMRAVVSNFCDRANRAFSSRNYARGTYPRATPPGLSMMGAGARCDGCAVAALRFGGQSSRR